MIATTTAKGLDMLVDIFFAVVVGEFLTRFDVSGRVDEDLTAHDVRLAVGLTGVVDIASEVLAGGAVDSFPTIHLKEILAPAGVLLGLRDFPPEVFDNPLTLLERARREEPEP